MLGCLLAIFLAIALVGVGDLRSNAADAVAILMMWGVAVLAWHPHRGTRWHVLAVALLVRGIVLLSPASLSDDLFRYLWEGHASGAGFNPYLQAPASFPVAGDAILAQVNHPGITSIYPPGAMWLFTGLAALWYDPLCIKVFMGGVDALNAWVLASVLRGRRRSISGAWLYALHPLAVVESAGSGHLEPVALLCLLMAIWRWDRGHSGIFWAGLGGMVKLLPLVILPTLWRRSPWTVLAVAVLGLGLALPFGSAGWGLSSGLETYARHWSFNASGFAVLSVVLGNWARPVGVVLGGGIGLWAVRRFSDPARVALWVGGAFVMLSPTVHPWYVAWAWLPALICGVRAWSVLATLVPLSYVVLTTIDAHTGQWSEPWWPVWVQSVPFLGVMAWEYGAHLTLPGPWGPGPQQTGLRSPSPTEPGR